MRSRISWTVKLSAVLRWRFVNGQGQCALFHTTWNLLTRCVSTGSTFMPQLAQIQRFLGPEIWNVENGRLVQQGKSAVVEDAFLEAKSKPASRLASRRASPAITPAGSNAGTPAVSGDEGTPEGASTPSKGVGSSKKKKLTRNQLKAKEERRRQRKLQWLITGGPKPDSDSDPDPV